MCDAVGRVGRSRARGPGRGDGTGSRPECQCGSLQSPDCAAGTAAANAAGYVLALRLAVRLAQLSQLLELNTDTPRAEFFQSDDTNDTLDTLDTQSGGTRHAAPGHIKGGSGPAPVAVSRLAPAGAAQCAHVVRGTEGRVPVSATPTASFAIKAWLFPSFILPLSFWIWISCVFARQFGHTESDEQQHK